MKEIQENKKILNKQAKKHNDRLGRNSNIELFRIVLMFFIVAHHFSLHSGFSEIKLENSLNKYIADCLLVLGTIGINGYILITGYYMIQSKMTVKKILKLIGQVWFYSVSIFIIFAVFIRPEGSVGIKDMIKYVFPILFYKYWFATTYVIILILSPFINEYLNSIGKKKFLKLIATCLIMWCLIPTIINAAFAGSRLVWCIVMYSVGGYIRLYCNVQQINRKKHILGLVFSGMALFSSVILLNFIGETLKIEKFVAYSAYFSGYNNIIIALISIELLFAFISMKPKYNKIINFIAGATFGVYLIHEHELVYQYLWVDFLKTPIYYQRNNFVLYAFITIILVYLVCTIIDLIRQYTIEPIWMGIIERIEHSKYVPWGKNKIEKIEVLLQRFFE